MSEMTGMDKQVLTENYGYNAASSLQIRLDPEQLLKKIEYNLRGYEEKIDVENGEPKLILAQTGKPMANNIGIQAIKSRIDMIINPATVQGNMTEEELGEYLCTSRKEFAQDLMTNLHLYGIHSNFFNRIISMAYDLIHPYMTRTKNNGERNSFSTITNFESRHNEINRAGLNPFARG